MISNDRRWLNDGRKRDWTRSVFQFFSGARKSDSHPLENYRETILHENEGKIFRGS